MKRILVVSLLSLIVIAGYAHAADVNGVWKADASTFIFFQEGSTIKVMCSYSRDNRPIVWYGEGSISGSQVRYRLHHTSNTVPAGWEDGIHELTVSPDGKSMSGTWKTVSNSASGKMGTMTKVGP